jgi:hypothetical protein
MPRADAERDGAFQDSGNIITPALLGGFTKAARERIRLPNGDYRRDHLRALAQRVEVADREVRIMGSKSGLFRTLAPASGALSSFQGALLLAERGMTVEAQTLARSCLGSVFFLNVTAQEEGRKLAGRSGSGRQRTAA